MMIFITGATGHFGKKVIDHLLFRRTIPGTISALVRDNGKAADLESKGINVQPGDYENYASLLKAFKGTDKLLLISGNDVVNRSRQQENVVNAAREAGIRHIFYTSFERNDDTGKSPLGLLAESHLYTEKLIKDSGIAYTIFRNNLYMDFIPAVLGQNVLEKGIFYPAGEGKLASALRSEMAEAAANTLIGKGHENKEYHISNTEGVTFTKIADILSQLTEKKINFTSPDKQIYIETLFKGGAPKEFAQVFAGFGELIRQGGLSPEKSDLEYLLQRKPVSVNEFLRSIYGSKKE